MRSLIAERIASAVHDISDGGLLVALSQPHCSQYDWQAPDADRKNGYARDAAFYVRVAGSHPSVVFYSMSHNATGATEGMNPDLIDGVHDGRDQWSANNVKQAVRFVVVSNIERSVRSYVDGLGFKMTNQFFEP